MIEGRSVAWILRLVKIGAEGDGPCTDVMEIKLPHDLGDLADLGLTLTEAKQLLAGVQREIVDAQARDGVVRRRSPTLRQPRTQTRTQAMSKKPLSPLPPEGDEDPVWGDLFGSMRRLAPSPLPAAETPTSAPPPNRTPTSKVRKPATKPKK
jgi:hypothetical protein